MTTSHLKYDQPDSGDGIATETFTEDAITKHFQRMVPGWKPGGNFRLTWVDTVGPKPDIVDLNTSGQNYWTATGGADGSYYWTSGQNYDWDLVKIIEILMASGASTMALGTLGDLYDNEYAIGDNDSLGYDTIYIKRNDPDAQITGYYQMHHAWSCVGATKVVVSSFFETAAQSVVLRPILYLGSMFNPVILDEVTLTETGETWTDVDAMMDGLPGDGFVFDTYGAEAYGFLVTTAPASGYANVEAQPV